MTCVSSVLPEMVVVLFATFISPQTLWHLHASTHTFRLANMRWLKCTWLLMTFFSFSILADMRALKAYRDILTNCPFCLWSVGSLSRWSVLIYSSVFLRLPAYGLQDSKRDTLFLSAVSNRSEKCVVNELSTWINFNILSYGVLYSDAKWQKQKKVQLKITFKLKFAQTKMASLVEEISACAILNQMLIHFFIKYYT